MRRNFSLVVRYSLKFARCLLLVVKSLVTRYKICSLLVAEVPRCKKSLFTRCKIRSLLVARNHSILREKFARYSLQKLLFKNLFVVKNHSLLVSKFYCYLLHKVPKKSQLNLVKDDKIEMNLNLSIECLT